MLHKISLSDKSGRLPYTAAGRLGALFFHQLGVDLSQVAVGRSAAAVFHFHVELTEQEHQALAARSLAIPEASEVMRLTDPGSAWMGGLYQAGRIETVPTVEEAGLAD